ncbi:MAG: TIGR03905 family TSCPD domain-containing protein [Bacillota bacterium]
MSYTYQNKGVCSRSVTFDVEEGKLKNISFVGGCQGNLRGIGLLAEGMDVTVARDKLRGVDCGNRGTSCPDQLSLAIDAYLNDEL